MKRVGFTLFALLVALCFGGCGQNPNSSSAAAAAQTNSASTSKRQVYHVRGVVKELVSPTRARIEHEAIPGYMPAMTMPLDTKHTNELANIKAGDRVTFDMVVTETDGWIENIARVGDASQREASYLGDTNKGAT